MTKTAESQNAGEVELWKRAFPACKEHLPDGGYRSVCPVCAQIKLSAAISRIDYLTGEPNKMQCSLYDAECDEDAVVERVISALAAAERKGYERGMKEAAQRCGTLAFYYEVTHRDTKKHLACHECRDSILAALPAAKEGEKL